MVESLHDAGVSDTHFGNERPCAACGEVTPEAYLSEAGRCPGCCEAAGTCWWCGAVLTRGDWAGCASCGEAHEEEFFRADAERPWELAHEECRRLMAGTETRRAA